MSNLGKTKISFCLIFYSFMELKKCFNLTKCSISKYNIIVGTLKRNKDFTDKDSKKIFIQKIFGIEYVNVLIKIFKKLISY